MSKNPYREMRKRNVVPIEKWSIFLQAAAAIGFAERNGSKNFMTCDPERAKSLLRKVLGEENLKHVHVVSSNKFHPEFEIDGITLTFHQGNQEVDDYFRVEFDDMDFEDSVRSMEDLGSVLMFCVDVLADEDKQYKELCRQMQLCFIGIDARDVVKEVFDAQEGEQIEPGQARIVGAAQIPCETRQQP
jgi:hypothetical protein